MPKIKTNHFDITIANSPLINIRTEFIRHLALLRNPEFQNQFTQGKQTIRTPYQLWGGRPAVLLSQLLRNAIHGLEAYVSTAVVLEAVQTGKISREIEEAARNPASLNRSGTADNVYNGLPSLLDLHFALNVSKKTLWKKLRAFYAEVRNPLFHGYELTSDAPKPVLAAYEFFWSIYLWADEWHQLPGGFAKALKDVPTAEMTAPDPIPEPPKAAFPGARIRQVAGWAVLDRGLVLVSNIMEDETRMNFEVTRRSGSALLSLLSASAAVLGWPIDEIVAPGLKPH